MFIIGLLMILLHLKMVLKLNVFLIVSIANSLISNSHMSLRKIIRYHFWIFWLHILMMVSLLTYIGRKPLLTYTLILKAFHEKLQRILQQNRFPPQLIDRIIKRFFDKQYLVDIKPSWVPKLPMFLFLPDLLNFLVKSTPR